MREAAERRQQLELEHEQALAVLSAKQQEIDLLQKAQVEAKKEHEGAVHLLENHLDSMQAKVRELEERCRSQSEQFNMLSKELERFRVQAGKLDLLGSGHLTGGDSPDSPSKTPSLCALLNGLGKGSEGSLSKSVISEFIRPLQMSAGEKAELLSVKPSFLSRSTPSSPRRTCLSEVRPIFTAAMERELNLSPRAKPKYTGKVRLCVARYNYNPYDGPNEHPEAELPLVAGKYLYVYGTMDEDGFYEGELLDGQQGLVPSNFVDFVHEDGFASSSKEPSYLNFTFNHSSSSASVPSSAVSTLSTLLSEKLEALSSCTGTGTSSSSGVSSMGMGTELGVVGPGLVNEPPVQCGTSSSTALMDVNVDEVGEDVVPYPRRLLLIKQLAKSVILSWDSPLVPPSWGSVSGYNVVVDQEVRASVPCSARTKFLVEKLNLASCAHRISVQSLTERGTSDPLRCTLMVGKDVTVAPSQLRVDKVTQNSAELSWMPSDSNYSHMIFLDGAEYDMVKPGGYKYRFYNLKPMTVYKVRVVARPHQIPWHLSLEQREKVEITVEFCTHPAGPPFPPQDVQVHCGTSPGVLQVRWKPPPLTPSGTSNGANVMGYVVCTKGQKIAEVMFPTAEYVTVELNRIQCLEAHEVVVRTISAQGESQDSNAACIPHNLLPSSRPPPPPFPGNYPQSFPQPQPPPPPSTPHTQPPPPHPQPSTQLFPKPKLLPSARDAHAKEPDAVRRQCQPWEPHQRAPSPLPPQTAGGHGLEPPAPPPHVTQRILPQPQGTPISNTVARAMARQAAQRQGSNHKPERRNIFSERNDTPHSDEEDDVYDTPHTRRRGASVDDFLRGSEMSRHHHHYSHSDDYYTESSRGSDLSDIMEEDEEDLYCEMQLEEGRRRSISSHNTLKILGNSSSMGRSDRSEHSGRRTSHGCPPPQRRPMTVPSIGGYRGRDRRSPDYFDESETDNMARIFVALFDYDPHLMSPNPDAAVEELPFKEGQIIKVFGEKDIDGFYRAEVCGRRGLVPCNMISEIETEDGEMMDQLLQQGFLPLNTPVEKIVNCDRFKDGRSLNRRFRKSKRERNRRSGRHPMSTRRMVALYDYDPRESSPNVDVEAELTFCAGDVIMVFGEIDEDGFYYGELNGHRGLVPSNFLEEVPDDVEVFLTEPQDHPGRTKSKRVPWRSYRAER
ncbi:RIMS-binding protein 2 isoform X8 [Tachysurus fulvidraco]|uniref:RIMS-binding protein 2 isoform X8 n=1 Tax=Tachysurus fulvidraco TaxID=1234273 RepID=UPI001FEDB075|nr:RIMS-binding protein 2 isoform X8 [Tachysurus fulvidraco]